MFRALDRLLTFTASLRLAVITIVLIAAYLALGTLYESRYGARAAAVMVYQSPWFYGVMALLALNVMAAAVVRFPWKRHQTGFVITHVGIEVLLLGCLVGARFGVDGRLTLRPGQSSTLVELAGEQLVLQSNPSSEAESPANPHLVPIDPAKHAIYPGLLEFVLRSAWMSETKPEYSARGPFVEFSNATIALVSAAPAVRVENAFVATESAGEPAAKVRIAGTTPDGTRIDETAWFSPTRPAELFGGQIRLRFRSPTSDSVARARGELVLTREDGRWRGILFGSAGVRESFLIGIGETRAGWMGLSLTVEQLLESAVERRVITPLRVAADRIDSSVAGAKVSVTVGNETIERWLVRGEPTVKLELAGEVFQIGYGFDAAELPFEVRLLDTSEQGGVPSATVEIVQPGGTQSLSIAPNQPGLVAGRAIYLSAVEQTSAGPVAFMSVRHDPGWPVKYAGSGLIVLGTVMMFVIRKREPSAEPATQATQTTPVAPPPAVTASWAARKPLVRQSMVLLVLLLLPASVRADAWQAVRAIPIQHAERVAPLDVVAREAVRFIRGRESGDSLKTMLDWSADPLAAEQNAVLLVPNLALRERVGLDRSEKFIAPARLRQNESAMNWLAELATRQQQATNRGELTDFTDIETAGLQLRSRLAAFDGITQRRVFRLYTVANPASAEAMVDHLLSLHRAGELQAMDDLALKLASPLTDAQRAALAREVSYWRVHPFRWVGGVYALVLAIGVVGAIGARTNPGLKRPAWHLALLIALGVAIGIHALAFAWRSSITGWAPVTNIYETVVWVGGVTAAIGLILAIVSKTMIAAIGGAIVALLACIVGDVMPPELGKSIESLAPVLRSNLWLTVHVLTVVSSYAAFALALVLGNIALWQMATRRPRFEQDIQLPTSNLHTLIYRCVQIGVVLIAAGTVLGAMWADVSWGRFWGWDPKEVWALVVLLTYLALLHGKAGGWIGPCGLAAGAVGGFMTVLMSWYGVNFVLGVGLHSYGFGAGGFEYVLTYVAFQLGFLAWATRRYRSGTLASGRRAVESRVHAGNVKEPEAFVP